jgi:hypothetical protein
MSGGEIDVMEYLKPRSTETIRKRRGREASTLYPTLVKAFVAASEEAMEIDMAKIGRKPETVRTGLVKASKSLGLQDKVKVSLIDGEVILQIR